MVDLWTTQVGRINDVLTLPMQLGGTVNEGSAVKFGTSADGVLVAVTSAAAGDGWGVALKYGTSGQVVPILMFGVMKCVRSNTTTAIGPGGFVMNSITAASGCTSVALINGLTTAKMALFGSNSYILGMALQTFATTGDTGLVLIGKCA